MEDNLNELEYQKKESPNNEPILTDAQKEEILSGIDEADVITPKETPVLKSIMDGMSDRLDERFNRLDSEKKGRLILVLGILAAIGAIIYLYLLLRNFF